MPFDPNQFLVETAPAQPNNTPPNVKLNNNGGGFNPDVFLQETAPPQGDAPVDLSKEATLGFETRSKLAIEPLEANRQALLVQQFGPENVKTDEAGDLFVREGDVFRPVNKPGLSTADFAELAGSAPEALGAGLGAVFGLGPASIPGAALGGAAGSAARQGVSALLGTPQVATPIERASEIGFGGAFGGIGGAIGKGVQAIGKRAAPAIKKIFPSFGASKEGLKLVKIAEKEGIPSPTQAQVAGGRDLDLEKLVSQKPLFGAGVRKRTDAQVDASKKNIAEQVGEFVDVDGSSSRELVGGKIKDLARGNIETTRAMASDLFERVSAEGDDILLPVDQVKKELLGEFKQIGLFDEKGLALPHKSATGMTRDQFNRIQDITGTLLRDMDESAVSGAIDPNTLNTMRKFIDSNIKEGGQLQFDDTILVQLREAFLDATENALAAKDKQLKNEFQTARELWRKQLQLRKKAKELGLQKEGKGQLVDNFNEGLSDEKVIARIFRDKKSVKDFKELADEETVRKAGLSHLQDLFSEKLGKENQIGAAAALNILKRNNEALTEALGSETVRKIRNNLFFLDKIGAPVNPSRTFISEIMTDLSPKAFLTGAGQTLIRKGREGSRGAAKGILKATKKAPQRGAGIGALLGDEFSREQSFKTRGPNVGR